MRKFLSGSLVVLTVVLSVQRSVPAAGVPNDAPAVEHALNRLTYGPRSGDIERVRRIGLDKWIDAQLAPATADPALEVRLPAPPARPASFDSPQEARRFDREMVQALASA